MREGYFDFADHLDSLAWMQELPSVFLSQRIDLEFSYVSIDHRDNGIHIYVGPVASVCRDTLVVNLDLQLRLIDYEVERIELMPE